MIANPGHLRPPVVYAIAIAGGVLLERSWPVSFIARGRGAPIGALLLLGAAVLFVAAIMQFSTAGTPVPGNRPTTVLVRTGPYRLSRNPIYLSFAMLHLSLALWSGSGWLLATSAVSFALIAGVVVPREERYLEQLFGPEYLAYKASVRRWL